MPKFARIARAALWRLGLDVRRVGASKGKAPPPDLWNWLKNTRTFGTVIDIGANNGEIAEFLARELGARRTYVFEPLQEYVGVLEEKGRGIEGFELFPVALSDESGEADMFVNSYLPASSLLHVGEIQQREFPQTVGERPARVQVMRLDTALADKELNDEIFIKVDVQGLEEKVIRGGRSIFGRAACVMIEMSFVSMHVGQPLFEEVHAVLAELGFRFSGVKSQINSENTGQPLFAHCLYLRDS